MMAARPLSVTVIAWSYILVGIVGFAYHVPELRSDPGLQTSIVLLVRLLAIIIGTAMLQGSWWARPAALVWLAYHVGLGALHSWGDALMHLLLLAVFTFLLLRPSAGAYFRGAAAPGRAGA